MKILSLFATTTMIILASCGEPTTTTTTDPKPDKPQTPVDTATRSLFIDVHDLEPGKVTFADVMAAHKKDLAVEGKYGVALSKFWVDEKKGKVYCLSSAGNAQSITDMHAEAHGLLPSATYRVTSGTEASAVEGKQLFLDVHNLGAGKVTAAAVADAHIKDLAVQGKYGVNLINYWVDEKSGTVFCLAQAADSSALIHTHKEAHGLLPTYVQTVKEGQ